MTVPHQVFSLLKVIFDTSSIGLLSFSSYTNSWRIPGLHSPFRLFSIRFVPSPWKGSTVEWIGNTSDKTYPRGHLTLRYWKSHTSVRSTFADCPLEIISSLISSKVLMNQFQRTIFLNYRKICKFESVLIHRRTHGLLITLPKRSWLCPTAQGPPHKATFA